jgi:predicted metal-dependent enzyme (double-stranded beta helix superfamily)
MNMSSLVERINACIDCEPSPSDLIKGVRVAVTDAITNEHFIDQVVERVINNAQRSIDEGAGYQPLYIDDSRHWRMLMFLWEPMSSNEPHQHNTWSVSGVMYNCLEVSLYARDEDSGALQLDLRFVAQSGETGYLVPPCIHSLGNPHATVPTVTLHVFNDSEIVEQRGLDTLWLGDHDPRLIDHDPRACARRELKAALLLLKSRPAPSSLGLVQRIFDIGDVSVRLEAYKQLVRINAKLALNYGDRLAEMLTGADQNRFLKLHQRIHDTL